MKCILPFTFLFFSCWKHKFRETTFNFTLLKLLFVHVQKVERKNHPMYKIIPTDDGSRANRTRCRRFPESAQIRETREEKGEERREKKKTGG